MKQSPQTKKLEEILRSSRLVAEGFLGNDPRDLTEIIDTDMAALAQTNYTCRQLAERMREITERAARRLGAPIRVSNRLEASTDDARGVLICPWPHPVRCLKRNTTIEDLETGAKYHWSDLSIHMIEEHGFFQGKGSVFRLEPTELVKLLFSD